MALLGHQIPAPGKTDPNRKSLFRDIVKDLVGDVFGPAHKVSCCAQLLEKVNAIPAPVEHQDRSFNTVTLEHVGTAGNDGAKIDIVGLGDEEKRLTLKVRHRVELIALHGQTPHGVVTLGNDVQSVVGKKVSIDEKHLTVDLTQLQQPSGKSVDQMTAHVLLGQNPEMVSHGFLVRRPTTSRKHPELAVIDQFERLDGANALKRTVKRVPRISQL